MDYLFENQHRRLRQVSMGFTRYMYSRINWNGRMVGIVGPRGVGKTTLMLQYMKKELDPQRALYISADQTYFSQHSILEVADRFYKMNGKHLLVDEVHRYPHWSAELKEIYDSYSDLQVIFSGSSVLDIYRGSADLSRRAVMYEMQGLSFREYLQLFHGIGVPSYTLDEVLLGKAEVVGVEHPLPLLHDYLQRGYYPFGQDPDFGNILQQVVTQTMENDIPQFAGMNVSAGYRLKRLMMTVAESVPFKPQMTALAAATGISRNDIPDYLYYMQRAGMVAGLKDGTAGLRGLSKIEKLYLDNTNLAYALAERDPNVGNLRETFFYNQTRVGYAVVSSRIADFEIDGRTFEIGGKSKGKKQIASASEGYVVKDDIEYGYGNVIPLWAFGLLY